MIAAGDRADQPVIIIGAARSGTNMLRDVITGLPGHATWPCDEINYIWRHGNRDLRHDELEPVHARAEVVAFVREQFRKLQRKTAATVVEKTCANSLRVDFVDVIAPQAKYVFIMRDGRDATASALGRWRAPFELRYILAKARYVPLADAPYYASRYFVNRLHRVVSRERRLAMWGPQFQGIGEALREYSLPEVAAIQWARSVQRASQSLDRLPASRVHYVRYEDFVTNVDAELGNLCDFLDVPVTADRIAALRQGVSAQSVGKSRSTMDEAVQQAVLPHLEPALRSLGYLRG